MIPFLENDDANRALMGANMQRQAVPLMVTEAPIVGNRHGVQVRPSTPSVCVMAKDAGVVTRVSADRPSVRYDDGNVARLYAYKVRPLQPGHLHQPAPDRRRPASVWKPVEVIADGPACSQGEIALGKNVLIGFMTWEGYNYEDAVLLNERLVREDVLHLHPH